MGGSPIRARAKSPTPTPRRRLRTLGAIIFMLVQQTLQLAHKIEMTTNELGGAGSVMSLLAADVSFGLCQKKSLSSLSDVPRMA